MNGQRLLTPIRRFIEGRRQPEVTEATAPTGDDEQWLHPILGTDLRPFVPPRHLWVGPTDPFVHFLRWPWELRSYLVLLCELRRDGAVLELGCSHGRTMLGLLDYLRPPGRYEGLDILPAQIEFAQQAIHGAYPHCNFTLADVRNDIYNLHGHHNAATYTFPYADTSFDVAYAASLFSHLVPDATRNYLREARRVLKPGGRCLFSFFALDNYRGPGTSVAALYEFNHPYAGDRDVAVHDPARPEQLIAYRSSRLEQLAGDAGLALERVLPGYWSNTHAWCVNEQDLALLRAV